MIRVLGGLDVQLAERVRPLELPTRKCRALLAYLALSPAMSRSREHLASVFWCRSAEEQARASLRQTLSSTRRSCSGDSLVHADADSVWLDAGRVDVDALQFEQLASQDATESLQAAAAMYRGELLAGFSLREEVFEEWLATQRRRLHEQAVRTLSELLARHERAERHARAIDFAERLTALDPLHEAAHCALLRLYSRAGRPDAALRRYEAYARLLRRELDIVPSEHVRQLAEQIGRDSAPDPTVRPTPVEKGVAVHGAEAEHEAVAPPRAERKQVTVLRAWIRTAQHDPDAEAAFERVDPLLSAISQAAQRFGGTISHVGDDGVTSLFGAPVAQEDHAVRACRAALAMRETIASSRAEASGLRIAVHSGEAIVRPSDDERSRGYDAIGPIMKIATQLDGVLAPGEIGVTADAARRAEGFVALDGPTARSLPGIREPVRLFGLRAMTPLRLRWQARSARRLTRLVGRETQLDQLGQLLARAAGGAGQVVAIVGDAGIGKSRLVHEFVASQEPDDYVVRETGTVLHESGATYLPIGNLLRGWFAIATTDTQDEAAAKLRRGLEALDPALVRVCSALANLLDLPSDDPQWRASSPSQRHQRTLDAVTTLVMRQSESQPLILVVEDLHWVDAGTQAVLEHLVDRISACSVLLLLTHRPEYRHPWLGRSYFSQLRLNPLGADGADRLLRDLLGADAALDALRTQLVEHAGGTPLFLEESVRALADAGVLSGRTGEYRVAKPPGNVEIPSTVHSVLAARIDRLPAAQKSLLQTAAVIGQDVPVELLLPVCGLDPESLHEMLGHLQAAEFLYQSRLLPAPEYSFKHALTRRVAYESVLRERRRAVHRHLVDVIETRYAARLDEHVERLAHHALAAEEPAKAVEYLFRSANKALQRSSHGQAIGWLKQGLERIPALPDPDERRRRELDYRKAIGLATMSAKGWADVGVLQAYDRARELSEELGDERELFIALRGEGQYRMLGGESSTAHRLGERCAALARRSPDTGVHLETHHLFWTNSFFMGRYAEAGLHCEKGVALYRSERDHPLTYVYSGHDPGVCCRSFQALVRCLCGQPDRAITDCDDALDLANRLDHPLSTTVALWSRALAHLLRDEAVLARDWAQRIVTISETYLLPLTRSQGQLLLGWALARLGALDEGIARMREGVEGTQASGAEMGLPYFVALLGEALGKAGNPRAGLKEVDRALATATSHGAHFQRPEMLRLKGDLLSMLSAAKRRQAQACYRTAMDEAGRQGATFVQLRAALSLARALMSEGRCDEARAILQPAHASLKEGHDTSDLKEATSVLAELGVPRA
ncbi:MAG: AAA family ATPase [Burkholderiaceae bacterium]|nr:AAA family ATPase [Burkholderiaceae bacterium]